MTPPTLDDALLTAARRELGRLLAVDLYALPRDRHHAGRIRAAVGDARDGVIELSLDRLLGHEPSDAERKAAHRALARLEAAGHLVRLRLGYDGRRATHLQLMAAPQPGDRQRTGRRKAGGAAAAPGGR